MSDPPAQGAPGETPAPVAAGATDNATPTVQLPPAQPNMVPTVANTGSNTPVAAPPVQSTNSNIATPASTPTPESTPTPTPVANTPTPLQQQQLQQLDHQHVQHQQQQQAAAPVGQPQLAPPQQQPQMMPQQQQQQPMMSQQQPQLPQIQMQQQQLPQLQHVQQLGQQVQQQIGQQQLGPQHMQMATHQQLQQPIMQQQQVQSLQQQPQQIQPTTALQQQLQQPPLQQLQQQVQVVQQQQAQQNMQQMTQNNQSISIVQSPTTMTGTIQAGTAIRGPLGQLGQVQVIPPVNNAGLLQQTYLQQQLMLQDLMNRQINIQPGTNIAVQQNRPQGVHANQQKTQNAASTAQGNNKQGATDKSAGGQHQAQQQQQHQQQGPLINGKPIIQSQGGQPLVIGRLGVISNQGNMLGTTKAGNVSIAGTSGTQVFNNPTQIRLASQPTLVTSTGQIINTQPIMLSQLQAMAQLQQNIPMAGAQMLTGSQAATLLGSQPLYIRTAGPIQGQQGMLGNLQAVTSAQLKGKVDGQRNLQVVKIGRGGKILKGLTRTIQPGQPGRPIQPKGGLPDPNNKPQTLLVTPKNKKQAVSKAAASTTTTTTASEQISKTTTVTNVQATVSKPQVIQTQKPEVSAPPPPLPEPIVTAKTVPPQASVQPLVTAQPTVNGTAVVDSNGTNGTITVTELGIVAKTEPMDVDREEVDDDEDNTVEMADQSEENSKGKLKAVVKPHILTHIIDNFVIQEANEPFPVQKSSLMTDFLPGGMNLSDRSDSESNTTEGRDRSSIGPDSPRIKCEFCGKVDFAAKFKRSKRFCSISCAKRYNVGCSKRLRLINNQNGIEHSPGGSKYVKKRKTPEMKKKWKRQEGGRVTTGPIQRTPSQCSEAGAWSSTTSEAASEITTEDEARSTTDDNTPNDTSPPRSPPVLEREGGPVASNSTHQQRTPQKYVHQRAGEQVSPGSAGLIVIQPSAGLADSQSSSTSTSSLSAVSPRPASSTSPACHRRHPSTWGVLDVYEFISTLPGCSPYADEFRSQEIDGQALMLLKEDHLMSAMNMKLGPALKICAKITSLKEEHS